MRAQCTTEVKLERLPWSTFHCIKREGHAGPHTISVLGSDVLNEWLNRPSPREIKLKPHSLEGK